MQLRQAVLREIDEFLKPLEARIEGDIIVAEPGHPRDPSGLPPTPAGNVVSPQPMCDST